MAAFDGLPAAARSAVREAVLDWDTIAISRAIARGIDAETLRAYIVDFESKHLARSE